jgi:hypothetical protein
MESLQSESLQESASAEAPQIAAIQGTSALPEWLLDLQCDLETQPMKKL